MDVYAVPVGVDRHELYCEMADAAEEAGARRNGLLTAPVRRFNQMMADAERERHQPRTDVRSGWTRRLGRRILRRVAEAVAEQRLLWHLRRQSAATLVHPDDLTAAQARDVMRRILERDRERHRFWLLIDGALAAVTGPLFFFVPGPNLVAYYFVFRTVGHYFSWRGARRGLDAVVWRVDASGPLRELREALRLPTDERRVQVQEVERRLRLRHLAAFVDRVVVRVA